MLLEGWNGDRVAWRMPSEATMPDATSVSANPMLKQITITMPMLTKMLMAGERVAMKRIT